MMIDCSGRKNSMEFYEVVEKRRTIRDFESEDIPNEVIERIISAAMMMKRYHSISVMHLKR